MGLLQYERSIKLNCFVNEIFAREIVNCYLTSYDSKIESTNIKLSLKVLCCLSDAADKKKKKRKFFPKYKLRKQAF